MATLMMEQYEKIKEKYNDCILMFRLGDFYEMFNEDAKVASRELELTLTGRASGDGERAPMCGVPFHSADSYISRLVSRGYKVAICEQMEEPTKGVKIVRRDVVKVITPGTLTDTNVLSEKENSYLCCIFANEEKTSICFADASTGELLQTSVEKEKATSEVLNELACFNPKEIILSPYARKLYLSDITKRFNTYIGNIPDEFFVFENCRYIIRERLSMDEKKKESLISLREETISVGATLLYLEEMQKVSIEKLLDLKMYSSEQSVGLDMATRRNLEITGTIRENDKKGSLLWVLDKTKTSMGGRLLRLWLEKPLVNISEIEKRHEGVGELRDDFIRREEIREILDGVYDLKRITGRISLKTVTPRDMLSLKNSVSRLAELKEKLSYFSSDILKEQNENIDPLSDIFELLESAISEDAPAHARDGGIIKKGFSTEVDEYKDARDNGSKWLSDMQAEEREKTGIKNLKVGYNKVFGYYIEVSKGQVSLVPDNYIRKQTLVNGERYITEKLKEIERVLLGAEEKLLKLEIYLFEQIRDELYKNLERLKKTADALSVTDVLSSLALVAERMGYTRPKMTKDGVIKITDGRHPVVEKVLKDEMFVPNDTYLDTDENRMMLITGPNMAGKSTYMRQVAVISLMAQAGSFVPAKEASLSVVDNIFTRVGASDDLGAGQSTFMVEMNEVSNILKSATKNSLIIFDEIGRGTSTFDGLSIAWAVAEFVLNKENIGAKTLFATHYHEMTELEESLSGIKNYSVAVKKRGEDITFLRKIVRGSADGSYGIEVAALSGVPKVVLSRAREILNSLEAGERTEVKYDKTEVVKEDSTLAEAIKEELENMDVTTYTPIEALNKLYELSAKAKEI